MDYNLQHNVFNSENDKNSKPSDYVTFQNVFPVEGMQNKVG